jgi:hypothetical protein
LFTVDTTNGSSGMRVSEVADTWSMVSSPTAAKTFAASRSHGRQTRSNPVERKRRVGLWP